MPGGFNGARILLALAPALAEESEARLQPGRYLVKVRLELPRLSPADVIKDVTICIYDTASPATALRVLSTNNPLGDCPVHGRMITGDAVSFDVACQGSNAAKEGLGRVRVTRRQQRGRIAMKMGGKNMTMTEYQSGCRIGPCKPRE